MSARGYLSNWLGHRNEIYYNPLVLKHYLAGFQYALGDLEGDGSPTASGK